MTTPDPDVYKSDWADLAHRKWSEYRRLVQRYEAGDTSVATAIDLRERALAKLVPDLAAEIDRLKRERDDAIEEGNALARIVAALVGPTELPVPSSDGQAEKDDRP